ncbi:hypothetical protein DL95DRAFT_478282 [Leptodontidium sp. 2 PMI_412]|nr:hypothetical protein DL95DRAFT_478282 [Leptodontidium sp. 2 PMI_412]
MWKRGDLIVVLAGTQHQLINTGGSRICTQFTGSREYSTTSVNHTKEPGDKKEEDGVDWASEWI